MKSLVCLIATIVCLYNTVEAKVFIDGSNQVLTPLSGDTPVNLCVTGKPGMWFSAFVPTNGTPRQFYIMMPREVGMIGPSGVGCLRIYTDFYDLNGWYLAPGTYPVEAVTGGQRTSYKTLGKVNVQVIAR